MSSLQTLTYSSAAPPHSARLLLQPEDQAGPLDRAGQRVRGKGGGLGLFNVFI